MTHYYPAYLNIAGRRAVVVGGGEVAERKTAQLLASGANVTLVSPDATPELERLASEGRMRWIRRAYAPGDLAGAWLAIAATDDPEVQRNVHAEAEREKTLLNVVDVVELCGFHRPVHRAARTGYGSGLHRRGEPGAREEDTRVDGWDSEPLALRPRRILPVHRMGGRSGCAHVRSCGVERTGQDRAAGSMAGRDGRTASRTGSRREGR